MSVASERTVSVVFTGDVTGTQEVDAAANAASPGTIEVKTLALGFNSISVPSVAGVTPTAVTIIPPAGNANSLTLKGVTGDTGIRLHNTDPTSIALDSSVTAIGLTTGASIVGVRFIWT